MEELKGKDIAGAGQYYEHIVVHTADGNKIFVPHAVLVEVFKKNDYLVEKKRTRSYLHLK